MLAASALFLVLAQVPQTSAVDPQTQAPPASISGIVRRLGTGEPVYKARLVLNGGPTSAATPGGLGNGAKTATTDKDGRFNFGGLDAGRYTLQAFANGYVRQAYGQKAQNLAGTPIVLTAHQQISDIIFEMTPTGTITGRIFDFDNMPMPDADVFLQKFAYDSNGQRTLQLVQQARTNDLGEYRLFWVTPGKYYLRADFTGAPTPLSRNPNQFFGPSDAGYAPFYYPGTTDLSSASEIEILPGAQVSEIDLTLVRIRTFTLRGRVVVATANGGAARPFVSLRPRQILGASVIFGSNTAMQADGTFEIRNVVPGSYILQANTGGNPSTMLRNELPIEVNGDMDGVVITLSSGFDVPFRLIFQEQTPASGTSANPITNIRPILREMGSGGVTGQLVSTLVSPPTMNPDGTFTISHVPPGSYQLQLVGLPSPNQYIKAIIFGHADALLEGITLEHAPDSPVEVLIGSNAGKIEGTVVDNDGKPVQGAQITLIPGDRRQTDRYRISSTDTNGHFNIVGVYPTDYKLFAWDLIEPNAYRDPEFIQRYENQGKLLSITEGANPAVELRVIKVNP